jgi:hypothetical protein
MEKDEEQDHLAKLNGLGSSFQLLDRDSFTLLTTRGGHPRGPPSRYRGHKICGQLVVPCVTGCLWYPSYFEHLIGGHLIGVSPTGHLIGLSPIGVHLP